MDSDAEVDDSETAESWLGRHGARELAFFSRRARSGSDPEFTRDWMKALMGIQASKVKALGTVGAAAMGKKPSADPLVLAAQRVVEMSAAELVSLSGFNPIPEEEEE